MCFSLRNSPISIEINIIKLTLFYRCSIFYLNYVMKNMNSRRNPRSNYSTRPFFFRYLLWKSVRSYESTRATSWFQNRSTKPWRVHVRGVDAYSSERPSNVSMQEEKSRSFSRAEIALEIRHEAPVDGHPANRIDRQFTFPRLCCLMA